MTETTTARTEHNPFADWCAAKGLGGTEIADLTGLSESMVSMLRTGQRQLSPLTKARVARRLGVRIAELFPIEPLDSDQAT